MQFSHLNGKELEGLFKGTKDAKKSDFDYFFRFDLPGDDIERTSGVQL